MFLSAAVLAVAIIFTGTAHAALLNPAIDTDVEVMTIDENTVEICKYVRNELPHTKHWLLRGMLRDVHDHYNCEDVLRIAKLQSRK